MNKIIYVDNNATTMVHKEVLSVMQPYYTSLYGNPSSIYAFGGNIKKDVEKAREQLANLIGAAKNEIVFTSCGTESNNTAIYSALKANPKKKHIIISNVEHPSIRNLCNNLIRNGYKVTFVPVNREGILDVDYLYNSISEQTAIISIMWANNETGVLFPVEEISEYVTKKGIYFHTDAVQAVGKIPINMSKNKISMLSLSGHKIHAPKGVGALFIRNNIDFKPFLIGGHQEMGRRGGTENVASIIGLGQAAEMASDLVLIENNKVYNLRNKLEKELIENNTKTFINGTLKNRVPNTTNISFEYIEGESILLMLERYGICASSGSACTSGSLEPSHVLKAMNVPFTAAHGTIRFSLSIYNNEKEINYIIEKMTDIAKILRKMSPFWHEK